jgi:hypothetical protein
MMVVSRTDVAFQSLTPTASVIWVDDTGDQIVSWDALQDCPEACYDLPRGTLVARGFNTLWGPGATHVDVADDYVVVGPPGPPLSFEVVLDLKATIESEGTVSAGIGTASSSSPTLRRTTTGSEQTALWIVVAPGIPFRVSAFVSAVGGRLEGTGLAVGTIRFRGVPMGHVLSSCQGFDRPTPTRSASWGELKSHYR